MEKVRRKRKSKRPSADAARQPEGQASVARRRCSPQLLLQNRGNLNRGLANGGLAFSGQKEGPFRGNLCSSPVAVGFGGIGPNQPAIGPEKAPIRPEKARFSREDFCPIFSETLGLKPPFVSPRLDFPNRSSETPVCS